jgi:2-methylfumaryl-CoA isomerase
VTVDGAEIMVAALTPRHWASLGQATGLTREFSQMEERHGVDLSDEGARFMHRDEISALLEPWFEARTFQQVSAALDAEGVVWGGIDRSRRRWALILAQPDPSRRL